MSEFPLYAGDTTGPGGRMAESPRITALLADLHQRLDAAVARAQLAETKLADAQRQNAELRAQRDDLQWQLQR